MDLVEKAEGLVHIGEVIKDEKEALLLYAKWQRSSPSKIKQQCQMLDEWGTRQIYKLKLGDSVYKYNGAIHARDCLASYRTPEISRGNLFYRSGLIHATCIQDEHDRFRAVLQQETGHVYLMLAEVRQELRGNGLMRELVELIKDYSFEFLCANRLVARADHPRLSIFTNKEEPLTWRNEVNESTGNTHLLDQWLSYPDAYAVDGWEGTKKENAFVFVNPEMSKNKNIEQLLKDNGHIF